MLDLNKWRLRGTRLYGIRGDRSPLILCRGLKFPLVRIDVDFQGGQSDLRKAGSIQQVFNRIKSGEQLVPFESRSYVFSAKLTPYSLMWHPSTSLPQGYLQVWEYVGALSNSLLNQLISFSNGDSMPMFAPVVANTIKIDLARIESKIDNLSL